jgi:hypothetical protein
MCDGYRSYRWSHNKTYDSNGANRLRLGLEVVGSRRIPVSCNDWGVGGLGAGH